MFLPAVPALSKSYPWLALPSQGIACQSQDVLTWTRDLSKSPGFCPEAFPIPLTVFSGVCWGAV